MELLKVSQFQFKTEITQKNPAHFISWSGKSKVSDELPTVPILHNHMR